MALSLSQFGLLGRGLWRRFDKGCDARPDSDSGLTPGTDVLVARGLSSQIGCLSPHIVARAASVSTASRALPGPTALGDCGPFFPRDGVLGAWWPAVTESGNRVMTRGVAVIPSCQV